MSVKKKMGLIQMQLMIHARQQRSLNGVTEHNGLFLRQVQVYNNVYNCITTNK